MLSIFFLSLIVSHCACSPREERFWPLNNITDEVNLAQSSPFGPRLKNSEGSRYDFHRGVDIPTPLYTVVYAIDDGTVRIPGPSHSGFSDGVVQLLHTGWDDDGDPSMKYYSTYIHMYNSFLREKAVGDFVSKGTPIGTTYQTNNFPHLHFEIRAGTLFSGNACNPWKYLPCGHCTPFQANVTISIEQIVESNNCSATVQILVPPNQLTFAAVQLEVSGGMSEFNRTIDICETNYFYTNFPSYDTTRLDDNTVIPGLVIDPHFFNSMSFGKNEWLGVNYTFLNVPAVDGAILAEIKATTFDVFGEKVISDTLYYDSSCSQVESPTTSGETITSQSVTTGSAGGTPTTPGETITSQSVTTGSAGGTPTTPGETITSQSVTTGSAGGTPTTPGETITSQSVTTGSAGGTPTTPGETITSQSVTTGSAGGTPTTPGETITSQSVTTGSAGGTPTTPGETITSQSVTTGSAGGTPTTPGETITSQSVTTGSAGGTPTTPGEAITSQSVTTGSAGGKMNAMCIQGTMLLTIISLMLIL